MPRIYRVMTPDEDGKPKVGESARTLGVRPYSEGEPRRDIPVVDGSVTPETGGMSVAPEWWLLPINRIPKRYWIPLRRQFGNGPDKDDCWRMGDGPFEHQPVSDRLQLVPDGPAHGTVQPSVRMPFGDYQHALTATRESWIRDPGESTIRC